MRITALIALTGPALLLIGCAGTGNTGSSSSFLADTTRPASLRLHSTDTPVHSADDELRVMSFNLRRPFVLDGPNHWRFRRDTVVRTIQSEDPDILSTQECVWEQGQYLRDHLPGYGFVGAGRDDGRRDGEMCAVFYKQDRFTLLDSGHFWLSDTPEEPGSRNWGEPWARMVTWLKLRERGSGRDVCLFNTHFAVASANARRRGAELLRQRIATLAVAKSCSVIVTGDFNDVEPSTPYTTLTRGPSASSLDDLRDAYRATHPIPADGEGTRHGFRGGKNGPRIDWVLTSQDLQPGRVAILNERVDGRYPSDHFPVVASLHWMRPTTVVIQSPPSRLAGELPKAN